MYTIKKVKDNEVITTRFDQVRIGSFFVHSAGVPYKDTSSLCQKISDQEVLCFGSEQHSNKVPFIIKLCDGDNCQILAVDVMIHIKE